MKKQLLFLLLVLISSSNSFSQVLFENGYFINENNQKINCLIENLDWKNTPTNFRYKIGEDQEIKIAEIESIKEFAIDGQIKFIKATVEIDRSSKLIDKISREKNPVYNKEKLFLQVLMEGKASLYVYDDTNLQRFFYKTDASEIKQLVYKKYYNTINHIVDNNYFRTQLFIDLKCDLVTTSQYENLVYSKKDLLSLFSKYNKCSDSNFVDFAIKKKQDLFNLTIRPRYNNSTFSFGNTHYKDFDFGFDAKSSFGLGIETEFILGFNKNKWSLIFEPTYQYYKVENTINNAQTDGGTLTAKVDYKSIEMPLGIRHYFFINNSFKIFANVSAIMDLPFDSSVYVTRKDESELYSLKMKPSFNFGLGLGCKFKDKFSLELRYQTPRIILTANPDWTQDYQTSSVILGYSFL